ncbi:MULTISPECIES: hypothetical protein [unclassified Acinetobacter]|uniref:hypothetical protein n=1 Tax=unclassified Acinetobacter TaxID=196816 RepID=UPI0018AB4EDD|nr:MULTISPECIES: hypothetical protein [unclassified Acinetobacter]MBJ9955141.1 hypothetical protein [Acinetobacter baumannii]
MLDFWYSSRCTREIKLISSILTCAIIYSCASIEKLNPIFTVACLLLGVLIHILFQLRLKLSVAQPNRQDFKIIFSIVPIFGLLLILFLLPPSHKLWTSIQAAGFTALGLFIVSIYQNRAKRFK